MKIAGVEVTDTSIAMIYKGKLVVIPNDAALFSTTETIWRLATNEED